MGQNVDYAALLAAVPSPCLVMTLDSTVVAVNQAYLDVCGRRREELLGRHVFDSFTHDRVHPGELRALRNREASLCQVPATGKPDAMAPQKYAMPVSGSAQLCEERDWSTINSPVLGPNGAVVLFVHRTEDVTGFIQQRQRTSSRVSGPGAGEEAMEAELYARAKELQELNEQVREAKTHAEQLLDRQRQFAADASHELRTPLAALRVEVEAAQLHPDDIDLPDLLNHVMDDLDRLENIINDLLLLARLEADIDRKLEEVDLTELVRTEAARWVESYGVRLNLDPAVTVEAASTQIARLLANLLENARRHATHSVEVDLRRAGDHAELAVADDGEGVPPTDRERIFQRFVRLDTARSRDCGGAGLGLAIARDIASAHHGTLHVEDSADGGACFVLRIPLVH
ncbi:PAS domain-containing sensor histidine kinase [Planotetraspora sp. A-T 1434]|uniref:PAS domain-containing sensor histidine kinase n=1 Tax=Planotetraspora sp. A-T 1434 TaxID=2979219 RepID=UPI0021BFFF3B|nr:PAS domain-containing sensor histidine kinase [Planotetraspora sp. A-T 1434]MCT9933912.1 PAS domain-containing sensor histidine kinase [Planotetraspora sp. A-T 1434]